MTCSDTLSKFLFFFPVVSSYRMKVMVIKSSPFICFTGRFDFGGLLDIVQGNLFVVPMK
jgi:hypothetical protein